jgi:hypothetical protein
MRAATPSAQKKRLGKLATSGESWERKKMSNDRRLSQRWPTGLLGALEVEAARQDQSCTEFLQDIAKKEIARIKEERKTTKDKKKKMEDQSWKIVHL